MDAQHRQGVQEVASSNLAAPDQPSSDFPFNRHAPNINRRNLLQQNYLLRYNFRLAENRNLPLGLLQPPRGSRPPVGG